jgi:hypothetical protein
MYLNQTYSKVPADEYFIAMFPITTYLEGYNLSPLLWNFTVDCAIKKVQENQ